MVWVACDDWCDFVEHTFMSGVCAAGKHRNIRKQQVKQITAIVSAQAKAELAEVC